MKDRNLEHGLLESEQLTQLLLKQLRETGEDIPFCVGGTILEAYRETMKLSAERIQDIQEKLYRLHKEMELNEML